MSDLIKRDDVLEVMRKHQWYWVKPREQIERIKAIPSVEPKVAEWEQIQVFEVEGTVIDRLQSTYCPICHRYHTTPYVYSYNHYNYCPNCGTLMKMKGARDE